MIFSSASVLSLLPLATAAVAAAPPLHRQLADIEPTACTTAFGAYEDACVTYTTECTTECTAAIATVQADCTAPEPFRTEYISLFPYSESSMYDAADGNGQDCDTGYTPSACMAAWNAWDQGGYSLGCYSFDADASPACSAECQALVDTLDADCPVGETYLASGSTEIKWAPYVLYGETIGMGYSCTCDLGYTANACDAAMQVYSMSQVYGTTKECAPSANSGSCSAECKALVDEVKEACPNSSWVPTAGWMSQTYTSIEWDPSEMYFGMNFRNSFFAYDVCDAGFLNLPDDATTSAPTSAPTSEPTSAPTSAPTPDHDHSTIGDDEEDLDGGAASISLARALLLATVAAAAAAFF
jgi:hypothetical protein